ncbi:MAG: hypothetical protein JO127_01020 [Caulobacteraceae bacterium]|nr:hypothetical protein [Caulobacteraceae bacterium]
MTIRIPSVTCVARGHLWRLSRRDKLQLVCRVCGRRQAEPEPAVPTVPAEQETLASPLWRRRRLAEPPETPPLSVRRAEFIKAFCAGATW